jgi:DNA polymerase-3 subunit delta
MHVLDYLEAPDKHPPRPVIVLFGEERFLKRLAIDQLRMAVLRGQDAEFSSTTFDGANAAFRDVRDELATRALFGGSGRFVLVEAADDFVSRHRTELERYVAQPVASGTLVLDVRAWPSNTRLYKGVAAEGLALEASPPTAARLRKWLGRRARQQYAMTIDPEAVDALLEIVGPDAGRLDQELAKLAAASGGTSRIASSDVLDLVGGWRAKTIWEMLDAALAGDAQTALIELDRLLSGGENPVGLLAQMGSSLRRLAAATRLIEAAVARGGRMALRTALEEVGVRPYFLQKTESQLRQLGRVRAGQLYAWLLEADLALKGDSAAPPRLALETLIVRMSKHAPAAPDSAALPRL